MENEIILWGVRKSGHTIDFLLTPTRDRDAAEAFLRKTIRTQGLPEKITIDKSGANTSAIKHYNISVPAQSSMNLPILLDVPTLPIPFD